MRSRMLAPLLPMAMSVVTLLASLVACTSGNPGNSSAPRVPSSGSSTAVPVVPVVPVLSAVLPRTATALADQMRHGLSVATTARILLTPATGPAAHGVMTLAGGRPTSLQLTSGSGARSTVVIVVNSVGYAKLAGATRWSPLPATGRLTAALR